MKFAGLDRLASVLAVAGAVALVVVMLAQVISGRGGYSDDERRLHETPPGGKYSEMPLAAAWRSGSTRPVALGCSVSRAR